MSIESEKTNTEETQTNDELDETQLESAIDEEIETKEVAAVEEVLNKDSEEDVEAEKETKEDLETKTKTAEEAKEKSTPKEGDEPEKEDESVATKKAEEEVQKLNLPHRLIQAAKRNHITDQEILEYGDKAVSILTRFAESSDRVSTELGAIGRKVKEGALLNPKKEVEKTTLDLKVSEDDEEEVKVLKGAITALNSKISNLETQISKNSEESTSVSMLERDKKIDTFFDGKTKEFSEFGNSKSLTNAELVMRKNVWELADDILVGARVNGQEVSLEDALDSAFSVYESKTPKKKVSREKILDEVKEREKNLIHRPSSKSKPLAAQDNKKNAVKAVKDVLDKGGAGW